MRVKVQLTLDARLLGEPVELELEPGGDPQLATAALGQELADEIAANVKRLSMAFPHPSTRVGATLTVLA